MSFARLTLSRSFLLLSMFRHSRPGRKNQRKCNVCNEGEGKYSCSACFLPYCSVACYKKHKELDENCINCMQGGSAQSNSTSLPAATEVLSSTTTSDLSSDISPAGSTMQVRNVGVDPSVLDATSLKPLSSLKWPYIADEEPIYPDPLERNDPKPLRTRHYEAIATSQEVRKALLVPSVVSGQPDQPNMTLRALLVSIDKLSGVGRERAIQCALGADDGRINDELRQGNSSSLEPSEGVLALRTLAEAIEGALRGETNGTLSVDWE
ncbi:hypothetical protein C8R41DRAFT_376082 [Lentinula lateritia]|uniref:HIT-type domain-containing protein n=1 Tax=Lentinula lateritia TaxID=40482 RepID=A0ABQ8VJR6_9AGAR|nr:hypothetical protein C8R41DRAFT_376082 [Lentinula lateritia]